MSKNIQRLEIFKRGKQWYFHVRGANNEIMCPSEGYTRKASALKTIGKLFLPTIPIIFK